MFNVGSGEAALVIFPRRRAWLMDCGANSTPRNEKLGLRILEYLDDNRVTLEAVVPSHSQVDHAGAIATVLGTESDWTRGPITVYRGLAQWDRDADWLVAYRKLFESDRRVEDKVLPNTGRVVPIIPGEAVAHMFVGSGSDIYTSLFVHFHFRDAKILFTGDALCGYENDLLAHFAHHDFSSDLLKVTHHGSSSGTGRRFLRAIRPGLALASSTAHEDHRLEVDVRRRIRGQPLHREVFETLVHGDITVATDGRRSLGSILYRVESSSPGIAAKDLKAKVLTQTEANAERRKNVSTTVYSDCS